MPMPNNGRTCLHCRRTIWKASTGDWYHYVNGSTTCRPGDGGRQAVPR